MSIKTSTETLREEWKIWKQLYIIWKKIYSWKCANLKVMVQNCAKLTELFTLFKIFKPKEDVTYCIKTFVETFRRNKKMILKNCVKFGHWLTIFLIENSWQRRSCDIFFGNFLIVKDKCAKLKEQFIFYWIKIWWQRECNIKTIFLVLYNHFQVFATTFKCRGIFKELNSPPIKTFQFEKK